MDHRLRVLLDLLDAVPDDNVYGGSDPHGSLECEVLRLVPLAERVLQRRSFLAQILELRVQVGELAGEAVSKKPSAKLPMSAGEREKAVRTLAG